MNAVMKRLPAIPKSDREMPLLYQEAVNAIAACKTFDEAKNWSDRADAMAAWAKIYADDAIEREAKSLKLHAYRRIGLLAAEMRPLTFRGRQGVQGPSSLLQEQGFNKSKTASISKIARMPQKQFEAVAASKKPPSPSVLTNRYLRPNPEWAEMSNRMHQLQSAIRQAHPKDMAGSLSEKDTEAAMKSCLELLHWLVPFHDHLKAKQK